MNAIPRIRPITARPLKRPVYVNNTTTLASLAVWSAANKTALVDWFGQLRSYDPQDFCDFADFCGVQYDREVELRNRFRSEAREEVRYEHSDFDRDTGIPHHGEI